MNTSRQYSKVSQGGDKLLSKRIRSNVPTKHFGEKESTQKNLQKTNPRMASARANPRQGKQSVKNEEQMLQQQQQLINQQMLQMGNMGAMMPQFGMPQQQMMPSMANMSNNNVGMDMQNQIAALQARINQLTQMNQLQAQLAQLQQTSFGYPYQMPGQMGVQPGSNDPLLQIANQIQYHDVQQPEGSKKSSPQKPSAQKKNAKKGGVAVKQNSERQSPDNDRQAGKRVDPVVLQAENLPVARTTRSGRPIENSPVKNASKNAGALATKSAAAVKSEKLKNQEKPTQSNSQATSGTSGTLRTSNRGVAVKPESQAEQAQKKLVRNAAPVAKPAIGPQTRPNKHQKIEENGVVRRSTRLTGAKEDLVALEDVFGNKTVSPFKKAPQPRSKYVDESSESIQEDKSDSSSNPPVRRSIRHRGVSPPKESEVQVRGTRHSTRLARDSQKTTSNQSQGHETKNEDSAILQQLKSQLLQTELEYTSKIAANKERDLKKEKRQSSSEARRIQREKAKAAYRPPTADELMLFGDVILNHKNNKEQVSEYDTKNPLETGGQQKFEAQTEIIMKNEKLLEDGQEFTDDEDEKAIRSQFAKEKAVIDQGKIQDMGILFGMEDDDVKKYAQQKPVKDENILFGETAQDKTDDQILVIEENSKSQNVLNLNSLPEQQDQEMKNESVDPKSQEQDHTVSDHEESAQKQAQQKVEPAVEQEVQKPVEAAPEVVEQQPPAPAQTSSKISDLDRQIAEIKKAIAIQQEITNRKLEEQAQKEQEEREQAEREEQARIAAQEAAAKAEEERLAAEKAEQERIAAEEKARQEAALAAEQERLRQEAIAAEQERLRQEALEAARIKAAQEEEERQRRIREEQQREAERLEALRAQEAAAAEKARIEREEQEKLRQLREQQELLKQQELARLREEQRKQQEALLEQKRKLEAENLRRQQEEAEERRKQEEMKKLIQERNEFERQEQLIKKQIEEEKRKQIEKLEQQAEEQRRILAEEQRKKAEREEMEERARLMQIAENPSTEQIDIRSDSMQDESDMQYGYQCEPVQQQLSQQLIEDIQLSEEFALLLKFQQAIDQSIGFNIHKQQNATFTNTKQFVEESLKRQFRQSHLQKILYVAPEFYNHRWEMKFDKPELVIAVPRNAAEIVQFNAEPSPESYSGSISSTLQSQRSKIFKMKLVQIMIDHFQNFKSRNPQLQNFNIHNTHKWPSSFDIEDKTLVPEIPLAQLKELPKIKPKTSVNDFISAHDHSRNYQQAAKEAIEKDQEMRNEEQANVLDHLSDRDSSEEERVGRDKMINKTGFSQATMDAIQFKQSIETEKKQKSQEIIDSQSQQSNLNLLIKASDQIKNIFTIQQGSTMFLSRLQQSMMDQHRGNFVSKDHVRDLIIQLTKIVPEWLTLKSNSQGTLVKCHKNLNLSHYNIRSKIEEYFRNDSYDRQSKSKIETNSQDQRLSKSCPPPVSSSAQNQKQSQGSNSGFKNFSAFQPFQRKQSFNNNEQDSVRKTETIQVESRNSSSINKNNFGINQANSSVSISGQGPFNRNYPDSNLQYQTNQIHQSSSGTYLSGSNAGLSGENENQPMAHHNQAAQDIQMSKYLSPQKPMADSRISVSNAVNNALESRQGMNNFGQESYQNSYEHNQQRYQGVNYGRSTSMPHHYMS